MAEAALPSPLCAGTIVCMLAHTGFGRNAFVLADPRGPRRMDAFRERESPLTKRTSIPHRPNLRLELRVTLQAEVPAALAAFPSPGFVRLLQEDDDPAHFLPRDAMQRDRDELAARGHASSLKKRPRFRPQWGDHLRGVYQEDPLQHATGQAWRSRGLWQRQGRTG